ncbi:hypothetical protein [Microbacterium sp.]|uniref:hypothetical protein n=1 Tax=Microbacterium sp. TaxID=51671 RepID=UPI003A8B53B3
MTGEIKLTEEVRGTLEALLRYEPTPLAAEQAMETVGVAVESAQDYHYAMKRVGENYVLGIAELRNGLLVGCEAALKAVDDFEQHEDEIIGMLSALEQSIGDDPYAGMREAHTPQAGGDSSGG